jgi:outer membrane lipoprotein-sorting protein
MRSKKARWVPAIAAPVLVAGLALFPSVANAEVDLPEKSPTELMLFMNTEPVPFSGTVVKVANLGLPEFMRMPEVDDATLERMREQMPEGMEELMLQSTMTSDLANLLEFAAGTHNLRIYYGGEGQLRVQVLDLMSQRDFIVNGTDVWFYDDDQRTAWYAELDETQIAEAQTYAQQQFGELSAQLPFDASSPAAVAEALLAQVETDAEVTVGTDRMVAGREAYELIITPDAVESTIESVRVSIDGENGFPLAVSVLAKGEVDPVFEIGFSSISFAAPAESIFDFTPGADVTVEKLEIPTEAELEAEFEQFKQSPEFDEYRADYEAAREKLEQYQNGELELTEAEKAEMQAQLEARIDEVSTVYENGWASVVELRLDLDVEMLDLEYLDSLVIQLPEGRAITTSLVNVLITNDGRVLMGAVAVSTLQALVN